jgi:hypothetical protein
VRRVSRILLLLCLSVGVSGLAQARERLVMPFDCDLENGRIKLSPATEKSYAIVGKREVVAVTTCRARRAGGCRTVMAHRFVISCGGAGLAWMRVAAAMRQAAAAPAWIDEGRLNLVLPLYHSAATSAPCMERPRFALGWMGLERRVAYTGDCQPRRDEFDHLVLPAGYAPIDELGAHLQSTGPAEGTEAPRGELDRGSIRPVAAREGETVLARADPDDAIVAPIPGLEPYDADIDTAAAGDDWVTVVRTEQDHGAGLPSGDGSAPGPWAWLLAVMALATAAGVVRVRTSSAWPDGLLAVAPRLARMMGQLGGQLQADRWWHRWQGRSAPESFINAGAAVKALLEQTERVVAELKGGGPLREVLQSELRLVRQALRSVEAAARDCGDDEAAAALRFAAQYRALVRELERIRRIVESAAASLSSVRPAGSMPRTTSEAYDVLGVNPDVSEGVLKKIVDALRMSWHPDHARDDEDRLVREDRMRQINIAWDLINGAREVA